MLRDYLINEGEIAIGGFKASEAISTGMGVEISESAGTFSLPAAETGSDIYLADKAKVPTGANAAKSDFSDYDSAFNALAANEQGILRTYVAGEKFLTDQFKAADFVAANKGKRAAVGTDGKWCVGATTTSSFYVFLDTTTDNGHTVAIIKKVEVAAANS